MKKLLQFFLISLFVLQTNLFPQSPVVQQIIDSVNIDSLIFFVKELSGEVPTIINGTSQTILSRHRDQPGNALAETYLKQKLESYGLPVTIQNYSSTGNNVLATQLGTTYPNKKFIICAHYDAMPEGPIAPAADDNASGTAAVLEAARILAQYTFPYTVVYALWDEEEQGLFGSKYYSTQAAAEGDSILGVINLDMIAYDSNSDFICWVHDRAVGSSIQLYNNMTEVNNRYGINLNLVQRNPGSYLSDHSPFWDKGYAAILFIENGNDFNQYYHTINDRVQYFNKPYFLKAARLSLGTLAVLGLNLNFDIIHTQITALITPVAINSSSFISTGLQIGSGSLAPRMYYRTKEYGGGFGNFIYVDGISTGGGNYTFNIPALPNGTLVQYYIAAQDVNSTMVRTLPIGGGGFNPPGSTPPTTFFQFFVADLTVVMSDDADSTTNWTSVGGWNLTSEKYTSAPTSFTDSPGGSYTPNTITTLRNTDQIQVLNVYNTFLEFDSQWAIEYNYDYGQVQISTDNGTSWISLAGQNTVPGIGSPQPNGEPIYDGNQAIWIHEIIDISKYSNRQISLRFLLKSDYTVNWDGWYIDNIKVSVFASILGQQPSIDKFYAKKDLDSVLFRIKLLDLYNHQFTSHVICANLNSTQSDSLTLLDDGLHGDSLANDVVFGGYIPPRTAEGFYSLSLSTVDHQTNVYFKSPDILRFTTAGPVVLDSIRFVKGATNYYNLKPYVRNEGSTVTISNAQIRILCNDPWVSALNTNAISLPAIAPGISIGASSWKAISYNDSIFPGYFNFKVEIESDGWVYWIDSIKVNVITDVDDEVIMPSAFKLEQNFPNPFNPSTRIQYQVSSNSHVSLKVYDVLGNEITTLVNEEKKAGSYEVEFNAEKLSSGVYFYKLTAGNFISTRKMLLLK